MGDRYVYLITIRVGPSDRAQPFGKALARVIGSLKRAGHDVTVTMQREPRD